jgi:hypothetical protein
MKRTGLIRLGGLAAMVGGVAWTAVFLLGDLLIRYLPLGPIERGIQTGSIQGPVLVLLVVAAIAVIAAIASLHTLQSQRDALLGTLVASLTAFVGLVMGLVSWHLMRVATTPGPEVILLIMGLVVATLGIVALGIITIAARVLPRWGGAALIAGSPLFVFLWPLMGVPWVVVGYAVFRAGSRLTEQPSRVR